jgi:homopolymeric O-antigen transport system permease protein
MGLGAYIRELRSYRELFLTITLREIQVRYVQSFLGIAWAVVHPFAFMVVFSVFLKKVGGMSTEGLPGPVYYYAGLLPWTLFAMGFQQGAQSVVANSNMVRKAYFPREVFPVASATAALLDHLVAFSVFLALILYYQVAVTWHYVLLIPVILVMWLLAIGSAMLLAPINVKYRDIRYAVPLVTQLGMFATVITPYSTVKGTANEWLFRLNPLYGPVQAYRDLTLHHELREPGLLLYSAGFAIVLVALTWVFFRRASRNFADII